MESLFHILMRACLTDLSFFSERATEDKTKSAVRSDYLFYPKDGAKLLLFDEGEKTKTAHRRICHLCAK